MKHQMKFYLFTFFIVLTTQVTLAQQPFTGYWDGAISIMGSELYFNVEIKSDNDTLHGIMNIPQQNAKGLPLKNVTFKEPKVHFELPAGPGLAVFEGEMKGDSIFGDFTQANAKGTFHLKKGIPTNVVEPVEPPPPYTQEEVKIRNGDLVLAGTLTIPTTQAPHTVVVMITGSGAQNRDEEVLGFKPFKLIADYLTRTGIAVLRCDDRGIGGSTGSMEDATGEDFAKDVEAMIKFLKARSDIDTKKIGLCGHSEGGFIASMVASRSKDIAFIILLAGPGVSGDKIILKQIEYLAREGGATEDELQKALKLQNLVYKTVRANKGWDELKEALRKDLQESVQQMTPEQKQLISNVDSMVNKNVEGKMKGVKSPWFKYFTEYDPAKALEKVKCPVLALFGELDRQVPPDLNKGPMENALKKGKNKDYSIQIFPKANHLFEEAKTGSPLEYASLKKEFVPGFLDKIADWIKQRMK